MRYTNRRILYFTLPKTYCNPSLKLVLVLPIFLKSIVNNPGHFIYVIFQLVPCYDTAVIRSHRPRLQNDLFCVVCEVKPYTINRSINRMIYVGLMSVVSSEQRKMLVRTISD